MKGHTQKRRYQRKLTSLMAEYRSGGSIHPGFIGNVSQEGMYMVTLEKGRDRQFITGKTMELKVRLSPTERIRLRCEVKWATAENSPHGTRHGVGLRIIENNEQYISFVKSLS